MSEFLMAPLSRACSVITDGSHFSPSSTATGYPYVTVRDVREGAIDFDGAARISEADFEQLSANGCRPVAGDVLFSKDGTIGRVAVVQTSDPFVVLSSLAILRPRPEVVEPAYLGYVMNSPQVQSQVMGARSGTALRRVVLRSLRGVRIPVAPLHEQRRIVAVLDDHLSRLDAADRTTSDALRRLEALRAATLRRAFEESTGAIRALLEVATIANGQTPKGLVDGLVTERSARAVPFFKVGDMNAADGRWMDGARFFVPKELTGKLGLHIRPPGTVLLPKRGGAIATNKKRILREPACYDLNTMGLVPGPELDPSYLWQWLQTVDLGRVADGSNVPQINAAQIRDMALPVPDLALQRSILQELDSLGEQIDRLSLQVAASNRRSTGLRSAVLAAAFQGKLTRSKGPTDV